MRVPLGMADFSDPKAHGTRYIGPEEARHTEEIRKWQTAHTKGPEKVLAKT